MRTKLAILLSGISLLTVTSCGTNETPELVPQAFDASIPSGAALLMRAEYPSGTGVGPTASCAPNGWTDLSGNGVNGTFAGFSCNNTSGWSGAGTPENPHYLQFDGTSRVTTALAQGSGAVPEATWIVWFKPMAINYADVQQMMSIDTTGGLFARSVGVDFGNSNLVVFTGSAGWNPVTVTPYQWQQVAVVFKTNDIYVYKNSQAFSLGAAPTARNPAATLSIGAANNGATQRFRGHIAFVAVYNRALSYTEINNLCKSFSPKFPGQQCE